MSVIKKGAKAVGKAVKKTVKGVTGFVKNHWKPIVTVGAIAFTGGLATIGFGGFQSAVSSMGLWKAVGSTMWAGATGMAGTFGLGSGASGTAAGIAGMQGATLMTGAGAQTLGLAAAPSAIPTAANAGSGAVGTYTGPFSGSIGGGGSLFGGGATQSVASAPPPSAPPGGAPPGGAPPGAPPGGGGNSFLRDMAVASAPALVGAAGAFFTQRAAEEAARPEALWGVDMRSGDAPQIATAAGPLSGYRPALGGQQGGLMSQGQYDQLLAQNLTQGYA